MIFLKAENKTKKELGIEKDYSLEVYQQKYSSLFTEIKNSVTAKSIKLTHDIGFIKLNKLCKVMIEKVFANMGITSSDLCKDKDKLKQKLAIVTEHSRLFDVLVDMLPTNFAIQKIAFDNQIQEFRNEHPEFNAHLNLVLACFEKYPEMLTGKIKATEVLFPGGSMKFVENIYKNNLESDYFNEIVVNCVISYMQQKKKFYQAKKKFIFWKLGLVLVELVN